MTHTEARPFDEGVPLRPNDTDIVDAEVDYQILFEEEVRKRRGLEGQIGALQARVSELTASGQSAETAVRRQKVFQGRIDDMRRGIASRQLQALLIWNGPPSSIEQSGRFCEIATDLADMLINTLLETRRTKAR